MGKLSKTEQLIENCQWQQNLVIASTLAKEVLVQAGNMGTCARGSDLSDAIKILNSCVDHFSLEQCDLEGSLKERDWQYENGEVDRETHPKPGKEGISRYLCDSCGCSLEVSEQGHFFPNGMLVCAECKNM